MSELFATFDQIIGAAEKIIFTIEKRAGVGLRVIIQPALKTAPDHLPEDQANIRAALALPIVVTAPAAQLDAEFPTCLSSYANQRTSLAASLGVLESLQEASKQASNTAGKAKAGTATRSDKDSGRTTESDVVGGTAPPPVTSAAVGTDDVELF